MSRPLNVCIVGFGRAGNFHFNSINNFPQFSLKYIVDPDPDKFEAASQIADFIPLDSIETALGDHTVDVVLVASPTQFHYDYIHRSLNAGKHVFAEKPLGESVEQIQHCFKLASENNLTLHLGFQRRYDKNFASLKDQLSSIGQARILKASSRDNPRPSLSYLSISGNIFHDMLIHDFDMLLFLFGTKIPKSVYAVGQAYDNEIKAIGDYDTVLVMIQYEDGLICSIDTSRTSPYGYDQRIEAFGEQGMLTAENEIENSTKLFNDQGIHQSKVKHSFPQRYKDCYLQEISHFFQNISERKLFNVSEQECLLAHLIADAAYESSVKRVSVDFVQFFNKSMST